VSNVSVISTDGSARNVYLTALHSRRFAANACDFQQNRQQNRSAAAPSPPPSGTRCRISPDAAVESPRFSVSIDAATLIILSTTTAFGKVNRSGLICRRRHARVPRRTIREPVDRARTDRSGQSDRGLGCETLSAAASRERQASNRGAFDSAFMQCE
jgi:hypothetical protein